MELSPSGALFSSCRIYRYALWRVWNSSKPLVGFVGLNPSTANENNNDPTIRKVVKFATDWGYGGVVMLNLYALVSPYPTDLYNNDPIGDNDNYLKSFGDMCELIIFAWGKFDIAKNRSSEVVRMFPSAKALLINKDGSPRHPLYVPGNIIPKDFQTK